VDLTNKSTGTTTYHAHLNFIDHNLPLFAKTQHRELHRIMLTYC
jgi:hypothetical protein